MKITLKNNKYEVVLNSLGAEINSFRVLKNGTQLVFEGPTEVWKYHAPVLFPHVGRIKDGFYTYKEKKYSLVNNGMSRDMEHKVIAQDEKSAVIWHDKVLTAMNQLRNTVDTLETIVSNISLSLSIFKYSCIYALLIPFIITLVLPLGKSIL